MNDDELVKCSDCGLIHKWSDRKEEKEDFGMMDLVKYVCPKCGEEGYTKQILN